MNSISITIGREALLRSYTLPEGRITKVDLTKGGDIKLVYVSAEIRTPFDYPVDYGKWKMEQPKTEQAEVEVKPKRGPGRPRKVQPVEQGQEQPEQMEAEADQ